MKIKLYDLFMAQDQLVMLRDKHYTNFGVALEIAKKIKKFEFEVSFYSQEEKRIAEQYGKKDDNGNLIIQNGSQISFENEENAKKFAEEITKLRNTEVDFGEKIKINPNKDLDLSEVKFSPKELIELMEFVDFVTEDK